MGFDSHSTSLVAALLLTPTLRGIVSAKERQRCRVAPRGYATDHVRWLKRLEALERPTMVWTDATETNAPTDATPTNFFSRGINPFVTGILLSGITALVLQVSHAVDAIRHFSAVSAANEVEQIAERRLPRFEELLNEMLKDVSADVGSVVEEISDEDSSLTKEEIEKQYAFIREVWDTIATNYYNVRDPTFSKENWRKLREEALRQKIKTKNSAYRIIQTMIAKGLNDPYAKLMSAEEFQSVQKWDLTGVGLNVGSADEFYQKVNSKIPGAKRPGKDGIFVVGLLTDSVSEKAGIQQGDEILEIDGMAVDVSSSYETARMINGAASKGPVVLKVKTTEGKIRVIEMNRREPRVSPGVTTTVERGNRKKVGRIKVSECNSQTVHEILRGIKKLESQNVKALTLDLCDNPGGLVEEAVEIAKLFLDEGSVVFVKVDGADGKETKVYSHQAPVTALPLTILVNNQTGSAAEIIAGALQDNCRGVVVGKKRTYGKGLIQSVYQLSGGLGLKLTVGKYYTPNMTDIDQYGIEPNFKRTPSVRQAENALESCQLRRLKAEKTTVVHR